MTDLLPILKEFGPATAFVLGGGYLIYLVIRWSGARVVEVGQWAAPRVDRVIDKHVSAIDTLTDNIDKHTVALQEIGRTVAQNRDNIVVIMGHVRPRETE